MPDAAEEDPQAPLVDGVVEEQEMAVAELGQQLRGDEVLDRALTEEADVQL